MTVHITPASALANRVSKFLPINYLKLSGIRWKLHTVLQSVDFESAEWQEQLQEPSSETSMS